jgi:heme exporter protein D
MIELGQHWEFLVAAYGGTVLVVGALIGWTAVSARQAKARVETLEAARQARRAK